jgi:hypothetical protein
MTINYLHISPATADPVVPDPPARPELSALSPEAFNELADHVDERDRPILAMLMAGDHPDAIAGRLGISARTLRLRQRAIIGHLTPVLAGPAPAPQTAKLPARAHFNRRAATPTARSRRRSVAARPGGPRRWADPARAPVRRAAS